MTRDDFEQLLNDVETPEAARGRLCGYGTWLRRWDPMGFEDRYEEWQESVNQEAK